MATRSERLIPFRATHPGEILWEELKERGLTQKEFAKQIGVQPSHLNAFIKGKRDLNEEWAMKLEESLGISYKSWMNLQNSYTYDCKAIEQRSREEQKSIAREQEASSFLNVSLLYKRLGITSPSTTVRLKELADILPFKLQEVRDRELQVAGLYKHSKKVQIDERNMRTWLVLNWITISKITTEKPYREGNAILAAQDIAALANKKELTTDKIKQLLGSYGIAYAEVEKVDKAPIDAYSTIANGHPTITVTYRYNDMDKLAFDILHELCHIDRHLSDDQIAFISVEGVGYHTDPREKEADNFAQEMLIPHEKWAEMLTGGCDDMSPHKIVQAVAKSAEKLGISPSIAVSRYKHESQWYKTRAYRSPKIFE